MSTTPTISKVPLTYSVLATGSPGLRIPRISQRVSLILLHRDSWLFRSSNLDELKDLDVVEVLSLEVPPFKADYESLMESHPQVRFLHFSRTASPGELINAGIHESRGDYCLVLWDDQRVSDPGFLPKIFKNPGEKDVLGWVPEVFHKDGSLIPSLRVPSLHRKKLKILGLTAAETPGALSLYPFDHAGLFHRQRFLSTGGFDAALVSDFWQRAEWGLRSCLWGESFVQNSLFRLTYRGEVPWEDQTYDQSYMRFFLKTMAVRFAGDHGHLPWARFFPFWIRSGLGFKKSLGDFVRAQGWVDENRYRFKTDLRSLMELWGQAPGVF